MSYYVLHKGYPVDKAATKDDARKLRDNHRARWPGRYKVIKGFVERTRLDGYSWTSHDGISWELCSPSGEVVAMVQHDGKRDDNDVYYERWHACVFRTDARPLRQEWVDQEAARLEAMKWAESEVQGFI
jgi:hypothetical protein